MPSALPAGALVIDEDDDDDSPPPLSPADVDPRAADDDAALAASLGNALRSAPPQSKIVDMTSSRHSQMIT